MQIPEFEIETWLTKHENDCKYNLTETCVKHMSLSELENLSGLNLQANIMNMVNDYGPITGSDHLKKAILNLYEKGNKTNIAIALGGVNANELVLSELVDNNDQVICTYPTYQQLYEIPKEIGAEVSFVNLKREVNWSTTLADFKELVKDNTKAIILNAPNNPTGNQYPLSLMKELVELCKERAIYLFCDEIYRGLSINPLPSFSDLYDKAIVTSSLSKIYSFAGIRLGWIKGPKDFIDKINLRRDYHMISSGPLFDYLATTILENKDVILSRNQKIVEENKEVLRNILKQNPQLHAYIPDDGTVCLLEYNYPMDSKTLSEKLQKETGVFLAPGACFGIENSLRFGFTHDPLETKVGLQIFNEWLNDSFN